MKNKTMTKIIDTACVINVERSYSKKNEEYYYNVEMIDAVTGNYYKTYVGDKNFNYRHWKKTIDTFINNNGKKTVILRGTIRVWKDNVVNADSKPIVVDALDLEQFLQVYAENFLR